MSDQIMALTGKLHCIIISTAYSSDSSTNLEIHLKLTVQSVDRYDARMPRRKKEEEEAMSDSDRIPRGAANARERMRMRQDLHHNIMVSVKKFLT